MTTIESSLLDEMQAFVEAQEVQDGYASAQDEPERFGPVDGDKTTGLD